MSIANLKSRSFYSIVTKKIALGSVQFGLNYGISNSRGKTTETEISQILENSKSYGIDTIDTARVYGDSEEVLGRQNLESFKIISKLPLCNIREVKKHFDTSLSMLNVNRLYGYLFHDFESFKKDLDQYEIIKELKSSGKIEKIGFSLYKPIELEFLFSEKVEFDIVQIPFSLLDRRFLPYFEILKKHNIEIHTRSTFLQGLFFMSQDEIPTFLESLKKPLDTFQSLAQKASMSLSDLALNYVIHQSEIDRVILGVEDSIQLENNITSLRNELDDSLIETINSQNPINEDLLLPSNWK